MSKKELLYYMVWKIFGWLSIPPRVISNWAVVRLNRSRYPKTLIVRRATMKTNPYTEKKHSVVWWTFYWLTGKYFGRYL